ncbi:MAG TPA: tyrosine-type recombinase/integrase [Chloroflexota bacterium]|nr:tyrosine-type recombinase/integrase [Chloroflexota bacterium]
MGEVWQDNDLVFPSEVGTPVNARNLDREYRRLINKAGVPYIRIHDIRHTVITQAIAKGAPFKAVAELAGHAKTSITMDIYTHVIGDQRREVADAIGSVFLE